MIVMEPFLRTAMTAKQKMLIMGYEKSAKYGLKVIPQRVFLVWTYEATSSKDKCNPDFASRLDI